MDTILRFEKLRNRGSKLNNLRCLKLVTFKFLSITNLELTIYWRFLFYMNKDFSFFGKKHEVAYNYLNQNGLKIISQSVFHFTFWSCVLTRKFSRNFYQVLSNVLKQHSLKQKIYEFRSK